MLIISNIAFSLHCSDSGRGLTVLTLIIGPPSSKMIRCSPMRELDPTHVPFFHLDASDLFLLDLPPLLGFVRTCSRNSNDLRSNDFLNTLWYSVLPSFPTRNHYSRSAECGIMDSMIGSLVSNFVVSLISSPRSMHRS